MRTHENENDPLTLVGTESQQVPKTITGNNLHDNGRVVNSESGSGDDTLAIEAAVPVSRPGISQETIIKAAIRRVKAIEALNLVGIEAEGILIPYFEINGEPVLLNNGKPYGRLRLDEPTDDRKYTQATKSGSHAYLVPFIREFKEGLDLFLTEGEFKCLALIESGYQAVALPGLYGYVEDELLPELKAALDFLKPSRVFFIGDSDTCLNYLFSIAAVKLAELIKPIPLLLPRLPLIGPKGIDDLKEELS